MEWKFYLPFSSSTSWYILWNNIYLSGFAKTWLQKSLLYTLCLSLVEEQVFFGSYFLFI